MFVTSKVRAKITDADPVFRTRYMGNVEVFAPNGTGCTNAAVQKLWDNSVEEKDMKKVTTIINIHGIFMRDSDNKKDDGKLFSIENISFCNAESIANGKIFSWISKEENGPRLLCHAVLCSTPEKAKSMALVMSRAFQIAYKEWKIEKNNVERNERKDSVKTKTAQTDLKLKPKYRTQNSVSTAEGQISDQSKYENCMVTEADVNATSFENGVDNLAKDEDSKSIQSSASSGKDSTNSKYKDSEFQTGDIKNVETKQDFDSNNSQSQGSEVNEEESMDKKDTSTQDGDNEENKNNAIKEEIVRAREETEEAFTNSDKVDNNTEDKIISEKL